VNLTGATDVTDHPAAAALPLVLEDVSTDLSALGIIPATSQLVLDVNLELPAITDFKLEGLTIWIKASIPTPTRANPCLVFPVSSLAIQADGKIVIGGAFSSVGAELQLRCGRQSSFFRFRWQHCDPDVWENPHLPPIQSEITYSSADTTSGQHLDCPQFEWIVSASKIRHQRYSVSL